MLMHILGEALALGVMGYFVGRLEARYRKLEKRVRCWEEWSADVDADARKVTAMLKAAKKANTVVQGGE